MDIKTGKLSVEDKTKFLDWINSKTKVEPNCPVCTQNDWSVGDHLVNGMTFTPNAMLVGGPSYPSVFLVCNNCAFTRSFMAVPIGILPPEKKGGEDGK